MVPQMPLIAYYQLLLAVTHLSLFSWALSICISSFRIEMCAHICNITPPLWPSHKEEFLQDAKTSPSLTAPKAQEWACCAWLCHSLVLLPLIWAHCGGRLPKRSPMAWFAPILKTSSMKGSIPPDEPPITILAMSLTKSTLGILFRF